MTNHIESTRKANAVPLDRFALYYFVMPRTQNETIMDSLESYKWFSYYRDLVLEGKIPFSIAEIDRYIQCLKEIGEDNEQRVQQYMLIRELLVSKSTEYLLPDVFQLLHNLYEYEVMSFPVLDVLMNNYGLFISEICAKLSSKDMKLAFQEEATISRQVLLLAVCSTPKNDVDVWENKMDYLSDTAFDEIDFSRVTEGKPYDGFYKLSRMIIKVNHDIFESLKDAKSLPYYYTDDVDRADSCIGNMITLVDESNHNNSVTFQIYAHKYYESFAGMIKGEIFGIEKKKASASAAKLKEFFKDMTTEDEALALFVVKVKDEEVKS